MNNENEFFGLTVMRPELEDTEEHNTSFNWVILNPELTNKNHREIEDGDYLEVSDNVGRMLLQKHIYRDYDTYYNDQHRRQLHNGMAIKWAPRGIALDYWITMFTNGHRARLVKSGD